MQVHSSWIRKELNTDVTFDVNQVRLEASSIFFTDNLISYLSESKGFLSSVIKQTEFPSSKYLVVTPPPHPTPVIYPLRVNPRVLPSLSPHPFVLSALCAIPTESPPLAGIKTHLTAIHRLACGPNRRDVTHILSKVSCF